MDQILDTLSRAYADRGPLGITLHILVILVTAWLVSLIVGRFVPRLVFAISPLKWRQSISPKRLLTLRDLIASVVRAFTFIVALIDILELFIDPAAILAVVRLFSFSLSMSARPPVS